MLLMQRRLPRPTQMVNLRQRWWPAAEFREKSVQATGLAFDFNDYAARGIPDEPSQVQSTR
jgi:hypothetical protein